jgi:ubiquitin-conjugating enzyme E2 Q
MCEEEDFGEELLICPEDEDDFHVTDQLESVSVSSIAVAQPTAPDQEVQTLIARFNPSTSAATRLIYDVKEMHHSKPEDLGFTAAPKGNNLFLWEIQFFGFQPNSLMANDLQKYKKKTGRGYVELEATFPPTYPMHPPFIRVVRPRFKSGSTIVTDGGSICTDVLTMEAWSPSYDIQGLILNVFTAVCVYSPRIDFAATTPYSMEEAKKSYKWAAGVHSWPLPPEF